MPSLEGYGQARVLHLSAFPVLGFEERAAHWPACLALTIKDPRGEGGVRLHGDRMQPLVTDGSAEGSCPGVAWLQRCIPAEAVVRAAGRQGSEG